MNQSMEPETVVEVVIAGHHTKETDDVLVSVIGMTFKKLTKL